MPIGAHQRDLKARIGVCRAKIGSMIVSLLYEECKMIAASTRTCKPARPDVADDPRWARIVARDKAADGQFWYSVVTTGVYCRPSCPSRVANPKNVQLHDTLESARATGFRPCRRCKPDGPSTDAENAKLIAKACRVIEGS